MALSEVSRKVWQVSLVLLGDLTIDLSHSHVFRMWKIVIVGLEHLEERLLVACMILYETVPDFCPGPAKRVELSIRPSQQPVDGRCA